MIASHIASLKFIGKFVISGEGNKLKIYNVPTNKLVLVKDAFPCSNVHGIYPKSATNHGEVAIVGGRNVAIFDFTSEQKLRRIAKVQLEDWIWDVLWLNDNILVFSLAHNSIVIWDMSKRKFISKLECEVKCILYSSLLLGSAWNDLVMFSGTVYNEIVVWTAKETTEKIIKPCHRLSGHNGVIFSMTYRQDLKLLGSTSDDRTLRIWELTQSNGLTDEKISVQISLNSFKILHVLYAHEARVWRCAILRDKFLSIGEDAYLCQWGLDGKLIKKEKCHKGGSIWSLAVNDQESLAVTGGSDSSVLVWPLSREAKCASFRHVPHILHETDFPRDITFVHASCKLLITSNQGRLISFCPSKQEWENIFSSDHFAAYSLIASCRTSPLVALAGLHGHLAILLVHASEPATVLKESQIFNGKVFNLLWLQEDVLLACGLKGEMKLLKLEQRQGNMEIVPLGVAALPISRQQWVSVALLTARHLVVGGREGSVHVYSSSSLGRPMQSLPSVHGHNGVTHLCEHRQFIYSAGRDGRVLVYSLDARLVIQHQIKTDMDWIGRIIFHGNDLLLAGFTSDRFIMWSQNLRRTLLEIECGGGHRQWDLHLDDQRIIFACLRKKDLLLKTSELRNSTFVLQQGFLPKKLWSINHLFDAEILGTMSAILAACGEDNSLLLFAINPLNLSAPTRCLAYLSSHISSIRCLDSIPLSNDSPSKLLVSAGGRAQIVIWKIAITNDGSIHHQELYNNAAARSQSKQKCLEPQTRYMDVKIREEDGRYVIAAACSDACLRVYDFCVESRELVEVWQAPVSHCLLKICSLAPGWWVTGMTSGAMHLWHRASAHLHLWPHQSGINALDVLPLSQGEMLVASGGDDNKISLLYLSIPQLRTSCFEEPHAHFAQITGIKLLPSNFVVSCSIDQRIKLWRICSSRLELLHTLHTSVADVATMEVVPLSSSSLLVLVGGEGWEAVPISLPAPYI